MGNFCKHCCPELRANVGKRQWISPEGLAKLYLTKKGGILWQRVYIFYLD
jgi:hypothetical protein